MAENKRIYILVKTYPTISDKYAELVCTAGVLEDGSWIRLYPVPFRILNGDQQFKKYTWINADVERNTSDFRPESYRPTLDTIVLETKTDQKVKQANWDLRKTIIFHNQTIYTNLQTLITEAKETKKSLALFKPKRIINMEIEETTREWDYKKLKSLEMHKAQLNMFKTIEDLEREFQVVRKVPYYFRYIIEDDCGKKSTMMIEDWEIGALYWNCLKRHKNNELAAIEDVKKKYINDYTQKDLYLILGTTKEFHNRAPNPFIIIGVLPLPSDIGHNQQISMFD